MECKNSSCLRLSTFQPEVNLLDLNSDLVSTPPANLTPDSPNKNVFDQPPLSRANYIDLNGNDTSIGGSVDCCDLRRFSRLSTARSLQSLKLIGNVFQNNALAPHHQSWIGGKVMTLSEKLTTVYHEIHEYEKQKEIIGGGEKMGIGPTTVISNIFYKYEMHELHPLSGEEEIEPVLKFLVRSQPMAKTGMSSTERKRLHHLSTALFKECGFSIKAGIIPVMSFKLKSRSIFQRGGTQEVPNEKSSLSILLCVRNRQRFLVYIDRHGRVYKNLKDWERNNTLPPSTLIFPIPNPISKYDSPEALFTLKIVPSPSATPAKRVLHVADVTIGVTAVAAGIAACALSGGIVLPFIPFIVAGEVMSTLYMSVRATTSIANSKRHKAKFRR